jgi:hypothetical protein
MPSIHSPLEAQIACQSLHHRQRRLTRWGQIVTEIDGRQRFPHFVGLGRKAHGREAQGAQPVVSPTLHAPALHDGADVAIPRGEISSHVA